MLPFKKYRNSYIRKYIKTHTGISITHSKQLYNYLVKNNFDCGSKEITLNAYFEQIYVRQKDKKTYTDYKKLAQDFYKSREWRELRYEVLKEHKGKCCLCGRSAKDGVVLHVDHIVPLSKDWNKRLDKNNLQVLCEDCNLGKSNKDSIDWR